MITRGAAEVIATHPVMLVLFFVAVAANAVVAVAAIIWVIVQEVKWRR